MLFHTSFSTKDLLATCHSASEMQSIERAMSYAAEQLSIEQLNDKQREAVLAFVQGKDIFVSLPTGFGKSICFQSLPYVLDYMRSPQKSSEEVRVEDVVDKHIALIVEPTAAIMRDQVSKLLSMGISAAFINHEQNDASIKRAVVQGRVKFLYISPESLSLPRFREMLYSDQYQQNLAVFAIDEAHCILSWANFRKKFQQLGEIRAVINVRVMALTATCTKDHRDAIMAELCMDHAVVITLSADRPNIFFEVREMPGKFDDWMSVLEDDVELVRTLGIAVDRKIVYCRSIEMACRLYEYYDEMLEDSAYHDPKGDLVPSNRIIAMYHSDSALSVKTTVTASLADPNGIVRRVFATQSLSMGIHCLNIREVIHWGVPRTLEDYYQECGRAGRDNLPARAILLFAARQLSDSFCNQSVVGYCTSKICLRRKLLAYFDVSTPCLPDFCCIICHPKH